MGFAQPARHRTAGALLPHLFTLTPSPLDEAVSFLWHFPSGFPGWPLASTLLFGVRTFLEATRTPRLSGSRPEHYRAHDPPRIRVLLTILQPRNHWQPMAVLMRPQRRMVIVLAVLATSVLGWGLVGVPASRGIMTTAEHGTAWNPDPWHLPDLPPGGDGTSVIRVAMVAGEVRRETQDVYNVCMDIRNFGNVTTRFNVEMLAGHHGGPSGTRFLAMAPAGRLATVRVGDTTNLCVGIDDFPRDPTFTLAVNAEAWSGSGRNRHLALFRSDETIHSNPHLQVGERRRFVTERNVESLSSGARAEATRRILLQHCSAARFWHTPGEPAAQYLWVNSPLGGASVALRSRQAGRFVRAGLGGYVAAIARQASTWEELDVRIMCYGFPGDPNLSMVTVRHRRDGGIWGAASGDRGTPITATRPTFLHTRHIQRARCQIQSQGTWTYSHCADAIAAGRAGQPARITIRPTYSGAHLIRAGCDDGRMCVGTSVSPSAWEWLEIHPGRQRR